MWYKLLADVVLLSHLVFILFVLFGALLVYKWPWFAWIHIPIALWGMLISFVGWVCPLTPLENYFRKMAGQLGYEGSFIEHYIMLSGILDKLEKFTGDSIRDAVVYKRSYAHRDFENDYNAFKGNAYGLANTLMQTAFLKPKLQSKKIKNLFYAGQLTVPGPGVPPALISGQVAAGEIVKQLQI